MKRTCTLLACVVTAFGCQPSARTYEITETRVVRRDYELGKSIADRFTMSSKRNSSESLFAWDTPDGWVEKPLTQFRLASFTTPGEGDCSLSRSGGSLGANVNRWRNQFGLGPLRPVEIDTLPKKPVFGRAEAVLVECEGTYQPMRGAPVPDSKMLGLIVVVSDDLSMFAKLVGPIATVDAEREKFFAFAKSLRMGEGQHGGGDGHAGGGAPATDPGRLQWTIPSAWEQRPSSSSMRLVTAGPQGQAGVECWVIVLPGHAGGLLGNVNRWLGEVGNPRLKQAELEGLPTINVLGRASPLIEAYGDYQGQSGKQSGAGLLGSICSLGSHSLFIKLVGPADKVRVQRANFTAFCESMRS